MLSILFVVILVVAVFVANKIADSLEKKAKVKYFKKFPSASQMDFHNHYYH